MSGTDFVMSLPKSKRIKHITATGDEVFEDDEEWRFLQYLAPTLVGLMHTEVSCILSNRMHPAAQLS